MTVDEFAGVSGVERAAAMRAKAERLLASAAACEKGAVGEQTVAQLLAPLAGVPGWHVLHDRRRSSTSVANIDHIVVGPNGVTVIDAKHWSGRVTFRDDVLRQNGYRRDAVQLAWQDAAALATETGLPSRAALCFTSAAPESSAVSTTGVGVMRPEHLLLFVQHGEAVLTPERARGVAAALDKAHQPQSASVRASRRPAPTARTVTPSASARPASAHPTLASHLSVEVKKMLYALAMIALIPVLIWVFKEMSPTLQKQISKTFTAAVVSPTPTPSR